MTRKRLHQIAIAFDQLFNTFLSGYADETLSARAYRMQFKKKRWKIARQFLDGLFFWQDAHCFKSYINEYKRHHLPAHYRDL